ncbi:uncharacterized protein DDB_G0271670-like isoform X2 [Ornithodoros turicata]|uniref:uncharacterized protein DDB_G0271670-like isoform X2 n=1 Tax=Ornithodoros turicata TaxID=34597 RepID=UPI003138894A
MSQPPEQVVISPEGGTHSFLVPAVESRSQQNGDPEEDTSQHEGDTYMHTFAKTSSCVDLGAGEACGEPTVDNCSMVSKEHIIYTVQEKGDHCQAQLPERDIQYQLELRMKDSRKLHISSALDEIIDVNLERCDSISTVNEYLTPDGSEVSITDVTYLAGATGAQLIQVQNVSYDESPDVFCSSLDVFPPLKQEENTTPFLNSLQASSETIQSRTPTPPLLEHPPEILDVSAATAVSSDALFHEDTSDEEVERNNAEEQQTATILDISDQRVNFMNTPSTLSPISSHRMSLDQSAEDSCRPMTNMRSTSSSSSSSSTSTLSGTNEPADAPLTPTTHSPNRDSDPTISSVTKLLQSSSSGISVPGTKSTAERKRLHKLFSWVTFKSMVGKRLETIAGCFKSKKDSNKKGFFNPTTQRLASRRLYEEGLYDEANEDVFGDRSQGECRPRTPRLQLDSDGDELLEEVDNETSDKFYSTRLQWNIRGIYQRAASYVHSFWGRGS